MGLIGAVELVANKQTRQAFAGNGVGGVCQQSCEDHGLIVRAMGGNSIALCPPLIIDEAQVDELLAKLGKGLDAALAYVQQEQLLVA